MNVVRRSVLPLLAVAVLGVAGCGGSGGDGDQDGGDSTPLPKVKQNGRLSAPDIAAANALCARYQKEKPKRVTQLKIKVKGSPSVPCIVQ